MKQLALLLLTFLGLQTVLSGISVGDRIRATSTANIRLSASLGAKIIATAYRGDEGTVHSGPVTADGYTWWGIIWDEQGGGFTAEINLELIIEAPELNSPGTTSSEGELIDDSTPRFRWDSVSGAEKYGLYISKDPFGQSNIVHEYENISGNSTSYTLPVDDRLEYGITYRWDMRSYKGGNWSDHSDNLYIRLGIPAPNINSPGVTSSSSELIDDSTPTFRWDSVTGAQKYGLYISEYPYGSSYTIYESEEISGSATTYTLPVNYRLQYGKKYRWDMRTFIEGLWSDHSDNLYFELGIDAPIPLFPGSSEPSETTISDRTPQFSWESVTNAQYYALYISEAPYGTDNLVYKNENIEGSNTTYTLPSSSELAPGKSYRWDMRVFIEGLWSDHSDDLYFQVQSASTSYTISPILATVSEGDGSVTFSISRSGDLIEETVYVSTVHTPTYGYATNNNDYLGIDSQPLSFQLNETNQTVEITILDDSETEENEIFGFILQRILDQLPTVYEAKATITIEDNDVDQDSGYTISPKAKTANEGDGTITFTIGRDGLLMEETVYASTVQTEGYYNDLDYETTVHSEPITFEQGQSYETISIDLIDDTKVEGNETYGLIIQKTAVFDPRIYDTKALFTIIDDDTVTTPGSGEFFISGATTIVSGKSESYRMYIYDPENEETIDITRYCRLHYQGNSSPHIGIGGNKVYAYNIWSPLSLSLYATYQDSSGQIASQEFLITLLPQSQSLSLIAAIEGNKTNLGNGSYLIELEGYCTGGSGSYLYAWDLDNDGNYNDATTNTASVTLSNIGMHRIGLFVTDGNYATTNASYTVTINNPLEYNQPIREAEDITYDPPKDVGAGILYGYDALPVDSVATCFDPAKRSNGLIIIVHGMHEEFYGETNWWPMRMARAIQQRYIDAGRESEMPNILIYDWTESATPSRPDSHYAQVAVESAKRTLSLLSIAYSIASDGIIDTITTPLRERIVSILPYGESINEILRLLDTIEYAADHGGEIAQLLIDLKFIQDIALNYGRVLAAWIELNAGEGKPIDENAPIHLIGHSAGGFLVGETALDLSIKWNITVDRVTMLDTPLPWLPHFTVLPDPVYVERYVSSSFGLMEFKEFAKIPFNDSNPFNLFYAIPEYNGTDENYIKVERHNWAYGWYLQSITDGGNGYGFDLSPFVSGPHAVKESSIPLEWSTHAGKNTMSITDPWSEFSTYGNVTGSDSERILTEELDAGLAKAITLPIGASYIEFECMFEGNADGDFLSVCFGDNILRNIANIGSYYSNYQKFIIPISNLGGKSGNLVFNLYSRGDPNTVIRLRNFSIIEDQDIDGDGIPNDTEIANGTDPNSIDTDMDGLPDGAENQNSDPKLADTDGDGQSDLYEVKAGTNLRDAHSVLGITEASFEDGFRLTWTSVPDMNYRIARANNPSFTEYTTITESIIANAAETIFYDDTVSISTSMPHFYRVEIVPKTTQEQPLFFKYNFDDNQVPEGWTFEGDTNKAGVKNGRFEAREVDSYSFLEKELQMPDEADALLINYRGYIAPNYWGMGQRIYIYLADGSYYCTGLGKDGYGNNQLKVQVGTGGAPEVNKAYPPVYGVYLVVATFLDGEILLEATLAGEEVPSIQEAVMVPELDLKSLAKIHLFVFNTSGEISWMDDVTIQTLTTDLRLNPDVLY